MPKPTKRRAPDKPASKREGWEGWDAYAPFYDWENARTLGRRDVPFWLKVAGGATGPVLELGCGTGRVSEPLAQAGVQLIGVDRSAEMLERAQRKFAKRPSRQPAHRPTFVRADIRALPFSARAFEMVLAPYGILQSLLGNRDLAATLSSVARVLPSGGLFGLDLVPDVPKWREYSNRVQLRGQASHGVHLTLVESVRQHPSRRQTTFEQRYIERRRGRSIEHRFELTFRTLSVRQMTARLARAGFEVEALLGDYRGGPWDARADVWIILAKKR